MSYILEALKRSQQERELGQVPSLDTNLFPSAEEDRRSSPWILLAVGLAMLAVIIALYAALRDRQAAPETAQLVEELVPPPTAPPDQQQGKTDTAAPPLSPTQSETEPPLETSAEAQAREASAESSPAAAQSDPVSVGAKDAPESPSEPDVKLPDAPKSKLVPDDLRADIEAFKNEVRAEESGDAAKPEQQADVAPEDLRLPREVEQRLPAFLMKVHVYDKDSAKRFVLINGLRTKQGERTREDITVEEILPDGAVLSYEGHKFFRHR
ncbi:MAG: general secretion pathway protein GspB [Pseudomonadota bacterium]|nr:general secretion pathway protein GspB [Pseudomonadota bacterium]